MSISLCQQIYCNLLGSNEILTAFANTDPKGGGTKTSAASENLFRIDKDGEKL